ncbi:hypothetical protein ACFRR6_24545 [Streptomyces sp. NPDC056891]|uniref:hypothetical protein n=1 Tax=Streptomyces sp. NPDC056891 TaxID=3345961 RepID=UPI0036BDCE27
MAALRFWFADRSQHGGGGDTFGNTTDSAREAANRGEDFRITGARTQPKKGLFGRRPRR